MSDATLAARRKDRGHRGGEDRRGTRTRNPAVGGKWAVGLLAMVGTLVLAYLLSSGLRSDLGGLAALLSGMDAAGVKDWLLSFGALSPVVYFLVVVAQVIASPIPAGPVTLAGALVFGVWEGLALSMAGSAVGSVLVFVAARRWGEPLVQRLVGEEVYRRYVGRLDGGGWWLLAILLFPLMPDDAVCALAGLSTLKFRRFLAIMVVGRIPGSTTTALLASEWVTGSTVTWISVGVVVLALGFVYRGRLEYRVFGQAGGGQAAVDPVEVPRREDTR